MQPSRGHTDTGTNEFREFRLSAGGWRFRSNTIIPEIDPPSTALLRCVNKIRILIADSYAIGGRDQKGLIGGHIAVAWHKPGLT